MRVNHFGQNSTVVYREKFFRLNPEFSVLRSQLKSYKYIGGTIESKLLGAENNFDEIRLSGSKESNIKRILPPRWLNFLFRYRLIISLSNHSKWIWSWRKIFNQNFINLKIRFPDHSNFSRIYVFLELLFLFESDWTLSEQTWIVFI